MTEVDAREIHLLAGRYQVGELIGRGGMADVHTGIDARLGRRVAIKLLKPSLANDPAFRTRFRREAQEAAKMAHPTIVRIFDAGEETVMDAEGFEQQIPFIIMEFVEGRLLKDILTERGALPPEEAVRIIEQVLTALEYSHRAGVVHRDIKPGNIMITTAGQAKVMDFGIARAISDSSATIAETSAIVGTAQYFSPEQARGEAVDARTDLYSTGVVLFELLTGLAPFRGENPVAVAYQHVNQNPAAPSSLNPKISPALDAVVLRALSKDRFTRFQTASEFRIDVEAAGNGEIPTLKSKPVVVKDPAAALFGVNPQSANGTDATIRQLTVDEDSRITRTQTRPPVAWIWAGVLVMGVIIFAVLYWSTHIPTSSFTNNLSVSVPKVVGETFKDGSTELTNAQLVPQQYSEPSDSVPADSIIRTVPEAGTPVSAQQVIKVYVSTGKVTVAVPQLNGVSVTKAQQTLTAQQFVVGTITHQDSPSTKKDIVISTTPAGGFMGSSGDRVDIFVSTGKVHIPSVVGLSAADAGSKLSNLQLEVQTTANYGCTGNKVTSQSLPEGSAKQKSKIEIGICAG
ncbi:Stk1 family PASTA domain-containing Ser/Thr kinase [Glaciihabitans sp. dw_435]|uniref:Stk1 family PASTA domain-containing Ser/Thr kinase n=1 Tax=Glaciihabitans sp. dw_435 TaxID=2720081 RepID=UPI001BD5CF28|nr:Stk1 family PASTA domain-containing Ser/Thr kinase [Glaciihabitans sp. dw_435]